MSIPTVYNLSRISIAGEKMGRIVAFLPLYPAISLTLSPDSSHLTAPPYERREKRVGLLIQILRLMGISTDDFTEALAALIDGSATIIIEGRISAGKGIPVRLPHHKCFRPTQVQPYTLGVLPEAKALPNRFPLRL